MPINNEIQLAFGSCKTMERRRGTSSSAREDNDGSFVRGSEVGAGVHWAESAVRSPIWESSIGRIG